jgi:hypothetical protein
MGLPAKFWIEPDIKVAKQSLLVLPLVLGDSDRVIHRVIIGR